MAARSAPLKGFVVQDASSDVFSAGLLSNNDALRHFTGFVIPGGPAVIYFMYFTLLTSIVVSFYRYVRKDYHAFLALGPGGTPSTFSGYLWVTFLKIFFARSDCCVPPTLTPYEHPAKGFLPELPKRKGDRPTVAGIAPHRQTSQKGSEEIQEKMSQAIYDLKHANPSLLATGTSCFEGHNLALFFSPQPAKIKVSADRYVRLPPPLPANPRQASIASLSPFIAKNQVGHHPPTLVQDKAQDLSYENDLAHCKNHRSTQNISAAEIAHLHTTDSSLHLTLHPKDAGLVILHGWGERHPLAGRGQWVPNGFVLVYAPKNSEEIAVVMEIIRAAGWWVGGRQLNSGLKGERKAESALDISAQP